MTYNLARAPLQVARTTTYQDYLDRDRNSPPDHLRELGDADAAGPAAIAVERYTSRAFYERERPMWDKVWQVACREEHIPEVGDIHVYDICNRSYLIVRTAARTIKAFANVCRHRGRKLRCEHGRAMLLRCPFHGFSWNLDGSVANIPCQWEFPQVDPASFGLHEVRVDTFAGWVFINPAPEAPALRDYLDPMPRHFAPYLWEQSFLGMHVGKLLQGNWKVVQEAFMESFHSLGTHPQIMAYVDDIACQYDQWRARPHVNRMLVPFGSASPYVHGQVSEQDSYDDMTSQMRGPLERKLAADQSARHAIADENRAMLAQATGVDLSAVSDAELVDAWYYNAFPNFMLFGSYGPNLWYRFRPWNDDHETTLMELGLVLRHPKNAPKPPPAAFTFLGLDQPWATAAELGGFARILDQDTANLAAVQSGLKAAFMPTVTLAAYQESRLRHLHATLDSYIAPSTQP